MIFAVLIFKEKVGLIRWGAALFSFSGGLLLLRPSLDLSVDPIALLCLFGALIMGLEIICIKILSGKDSVFTILILNNFPEETLHNQADLEELQTRNSSGLFLNLLL